MDELVKELKQKVSFDIPYPCLEGICYQKVSFSIYDIYNGAKYIEDELEKELSKALYEAACLFGLGKIYKALKKEADSIVANTVKSLLNQLKGFVFKILNLDQLQSQLNDLLTSLQHLDPLNGIDCSKLENDLDAIDSQLNTFKEILKKCQGVIVKS